MCRRSFPTFASGALREILEKASEERTEGEIEEARSFEIMAHRWLLASKGSMLSPFLFNFHALNGFLLRFRRELEVYATIDKLQDA